MPQTSPELYEKLRLKVQSQFDVGPDPWNTVLADHGDVRIYCENLIVSDGFIIEGGWIREPEKYADKMLPEDIADAIQYLIEEWDFALGGCPLGCSVNYHPLFPEDEK